MKLVNGIPQGEYLRGLRVAALAKGLCYECRCRPIKAPGIKRCETCLSRGYERKAEMEQRYRDSGLCSCGRPRRLNGATCRRCWRRMLFCNRKAWTENLRLGICPRCRGDLDRDDRSLCNACLRENAIRTRTYYTPTEKRHCSVCGSPNHNARGHESAVASRCA